MEKNINTVTVPKGFVFFEDRLDPVPGYLPFTIGEWLSETGNIATFVGYEGKCLEYTFVESVAASIWRHVLKLNPGILTRYETLFCLYHQETDKVYVVGWERQGLFFDVKEMLENYGNYCELWPILGDEHVTGGERKR